MLAYKKKLKSGKKKRLSSLLSLSLSCVFFLSFCLFGLSLSLSDCPETAGSKRAERVLMFVIVITRSLPGLPKDFVPKDSKLLLPKEFQPNKEFHPKISSHDGDDDEEEEETDGHHDDGDDQHPNSFPSMPGSLPRTNAGHGIKRAQSHIL